MVSRTFKACDENMQAVNDFIHSNFPENISPKAAGEIDLAVEEIFVNIAHYAYHPETGTVEIECSVDEEGFLYSEIDEKRCIECGKCRKACISHISPTQNDFKAVLGCYTNDKDILGHSTSGGIFYLLAVSFVTYITL